MPSRTSARKAEQPPAGSAASAPAAPAPVSSRSKRGIIMRTAVEHFGTKGYDDTIWSEVAVEVGLGGTALYHYFESKQHCLFDIMAEALDGYRRAFESAVASEPDYLAGLRAALRSGFDLDDHEVLRLRVLVDKQGSIGGRPSSTPREEASRLRARENIRGLEMDWAAYLARGVAAGVIPNNDMRLLARAVLALNTSVWQWYRPGGPIALEEVADFYVGKQLAVIGVAG